MEYLLLALTAVACTFQNIFKKKFNQTSGGGVFCFTSVVACFAMLCFIAINRYWIFDAELLLPAGAFALSYAATTVFNVLAIKHGSLAKTSLIISCSLLVPSIFGILFLDEPFSITLVIGIVTLITSLVMINYKKKKDNEKKTTVKWVIFSAIAFLGNGMCSTVQKIETFIYGTEGKNLFMIFALAMVSIIMMIFAMSSKNERKFCKSSLKLGIHWAVLCGVTNGVVNCLTVYLNPVMPASVMYPVISAGSIVLTFIYSIICLKEKFSAWQKLGFLLGVISIILLNL